jgi:hypothetical protein
MECAHDYVEQSDGVHVCCLCAHEKPPTQIAKARTANLVFGANNPPPNLLTRGGTVLTPKTIVCKLARDELGWPIALEVHFNETLCVGVPLPVAKSAARELGRVILLADELGGFPGVTIGTGTIVISYVAATGEVCVTFRCSEDRSAAYTGTPEAQGRFRSALDRIIRAVERETGEMVPYA